jgi:hypothetical protein
LTYHCLWFFSFNFFTIQIKLDTNRESCTCPIKLYRWHFSFISIYIRNRPNIQNVLLFRYFNQISGSKIDCEILLCFTLYSLFNSALNHPKSNNDGRKRSYTEKYDGLHVTVLRSYISVSYTELVTVDLGEYYNFDELSGYEKRKTKFKSLFFCRSLLSMIMYIITFCQNSEVEYLFLQWIGNLCQDEYLNDGIKILI